MRELNESQKRDIRMYGVTEAEMREAVEQRLAFHRDPAMMVASLLSDCQEMVAYGPYDSDTLAAIIAGPEKRNVMLSSTASRIWSWVQPYMRTSRFWDSVISAKRTVI